MVTTVHFEHDEVKYIASQNFTFSSREKAYGEVRKILGRVFIAERVIDIPTSSFWGSESCTIWEPASFNLEPSDRIDVQIAIVRGGDIEANLENTVAKWGKKYVDEQKLEERNP